MFLHKTTFKILLHPCNINVDYGPLRGDPPEWKKRDSVRAKFWATNQWLMMLNRSERPSSISIMVLEGIVSDNDIRRSFYLLLPALKASSRDGNSKIPRSATGKKKLGAGRFMCKSSRSSKGMRRMLEVGHILLFKRLEAKNLLGRILYKNAGSMLNASTPSHHPSIALTPILQPSRILNKVNAA